MAFIWERKEDALFFFSNKLKPTSFHSKHLMKLNHGCEIPFQAQVLHTCTFIPEGRNLDWSL